MNGEARPILALGGPEVGERPKRKSPNPPQVSKPSAGRQGTRLTSRFTALAEAFAEARARLVDGTVDEIDPELVVVFDLAGTIKDFHNAIKTVDGLEFLTEFLDEDSEPDDDFHMVASDAERTDKQVQHSLCLVMSNATAVSQLIRLFKQWQQDPAKAFEHGQNKFRTAFEHLRDIRRWDVRDRVRETGLMDDWKERLEVAGQSFSPVVVEIELWYRSRADRRAAAETQVKSLAEAVGGAVRHSAQIGEIAYHALLVELPVQQAEAVLRDGAGAIDLLNTDEIMFVSPYMPMAVESPPVDPVATADLPAGARVGGPPRVALFDGLPVVNHDVLANRLVVDDPDEFGVDYPAFARGHGTAMASLIIHGDLSRPGGPLDRPLYVRPIMRPHEMRPGQERVVDDRLFPDLLHRAVMRMVDDTTGVAASAPSVRVVNLSIGVESRALVRRMSPLGRLLDWLSVKYNLLFVVSAGNHLRIPLAIPAADAGDVARARVAALKAARETSRLRGVLPPGDALNALTVGAVHTDAAGDQKPSDVVWDVVGPGMPALYGAVGPGVGRSIKPDIYHSGGRALYTRPVLRPADEKVVLGLAETSATGPGHRVAAPDRHGATNATRFSHGTSNAAALVTREASRVFELLEQGRADRADFAFPDSQFHPVLVKSLLVHAASWGSLGDQLRRGLDVDPSRARRELTSLLGYGCLDVDRAGTAATNRAVLIAGGSIGHDERHTYSVPLPGSLEAKAEWHRFIVTLAFMAPTIGHLSRYRGAKVFFETPEKVATGGAPLEAEHYAVRRGSCQHEIIEGARAMVYAQNRVLPIDVSCMDDAQRLAAGKKIRYGLVVSVETAVTTSLTVHQDIRTRLQEQARAQVRPRLQP